jgi:hypothetical protein
MDCCPPTTTLLPSTTKSLPLAISNQRLYSSERRTHPRPPLTWCAQRGTPPHPRRRAGTGSLAPSWRARPCRPAGGPSSQGSYGTPQSQGATGRPPLACRALGVRTPACRAPGARAGVVLGCGPDGLEGQMRRPSCSAYASIHPCKQPSTTLTPPSRMPHRTCCSSSRRPAGSMPRTTVGETASPLWLTQRSPGRSVPVSSSAAT